MPGYAHLFFDKVKRKFLCPLCQLPMRDPVQVTTCRHRYCDSCLQAQLSGRTFCKCPEDQLPIDYAKIYPDRELQVEIMTSRVRCSRHLEGCNWVDKLSNLQDHLEMCRFNTVPCPNQCTAMMSRLCLKDHVQYTCLRRKVLCECCQQEYTGEAMETHQGNCPKEIVWCENKCGARLQRQYLSNHMNNECHKRTLPCRYCHKKFVYETLQDHFYRCPRYPIMCPNRCDPTKIAREDMEKHIGAECPSSTIPCSFTDVGCKVMVPRFCLEKHLEEAMSTHLSMMCTLALSQEMQIKELRKELDTMTRFTNGTFIWKIPNITTKMNEAKAKITELKSEPFYTCRYGYRLGASVFLNGNGSGEGRHISLYIRVLQGEYDNILDWPFHLPISFQLLDQCSDPEKRIPIFESFVPVPTLKHFQRPEEGLDSMGFGYPKFVTHETLKNGTYIKDDAIFIKIKVDVNKFILP